MKVMSHQHFHKRKQCPPRSSVKRAPALASGTSRRLGWSAALVERLFRRILSPLKHSKQMVLARGMRWIQRLRILQTKSQTMPTTVHLSTERIFHTTGVTHMAHSSLQAAAPRQALGKSSRRVVAPALAESGASAATISAKTVRRMRSVEVAEKTTYRHVSGSRLLLTSPTLQVSSLGHPVMRTPQHRLIDVAAVNGLPDRVVKKHRRLEQRPVTDVQTPPAKVPGVPPGEAPTMVDKSLPRLRREAAKQSVSEGGRRTPVVQPEPVPNVAQITDAVLKQLDHRLIAARERMGRI